MWISWWTDPLRKVGHGPYHSAPTPILGRSESSVPSGKRFLPRHSEARPPMSQRSMPSSARPMPADPAADPPPPDVAEFIRFCHDRKPVGWPELYDEMCAVAARREFNGWDHDQFAARGLTFSLFEMTQALGLGAGSARRAAGADRGRGRPPRPGLTRAARGLRVRSHVLRLARASSRSGRGASAHQVVHIGPSARTRMSTKVRPSRCGGAPSRVRSGAP